MTHEKWLAELYAIPAPPYKRGCYKNGEPIPDEPEMKNDDEILRIQSK